MPESQSRNWNTPINHKLYEISLTAPEPHYLNRGVSEKILPTSRASDS